MQWFVIQILINYFKYICIGKRGVEGGDEEGEMGGGG